MTTGECWASAVGHLSLLYQLRLNLVVAIYLVGASVLCRLSVASLHAFLEIAGVDVLTCSQVEPLAKP